MLENSTEYIPRIADSLLKRKLESFGAVVITGPKRCGKTTTAMRHSKSAIFLQDPDVREKYRSMAELKPSNLLKGDNPLLIDEWQSIPVLWDTVRHSVDRRNEEGLYIMTGSVAANSEKIEHSGAGRITCMRMDTLSLFESGDSDGSVKLSELFAGKDADGVSEMDTGDVAKLITRGGWPKSIGKSESATYDMVSGYCERILDSDIIMADGVRRDTQTMRLILRSLSRNESTRVSDTKILGDISEKDSGSMHLNTLKNYLKTLDRIYVTGNLPAWCPKLRSKSSVMASPTRHLSDPAMAAYFLGTSSEDLESDPETFGLLFESMVIRDLRVYAQSLDGDVMHYRDSDGLETDAIIHLRNGKWCALEVKLGIGGIDAAAGNLKKLARKVDADSMNPPSFLAVITGTGYAYTREDGIHVIPIGCLGN